MADSRCILVRLQEYCLAGKCAFPLTLKRQTVPDVFDVCKKLENGLPNFLDNPVFEYMLTINDSVINQRVK